MKPTKPIDTKRMFVIPMVFLLFITVTFGFITFYFTLNRFKQTMIDYTNESQPETQNIEEKDFF